MADPDIPPHLTDHEAVARKVCNCGGCQGREGAWWPCKRRVVAFALEATDKAARKAERDKCRAQVRAFAAQYRDARIFGTSEETGKMLLKFADVDMDPLFTQGDEETHNVE